MRQSFVAPSAMDSLCELQSRVEAEVDRSYHVLIKGLIADAIESCKLKPDSSTAFAAGMNRCQTAPHHSFPHRRSRMPRGRLGSPPRQRGLCRLDDLRNNLTQNRSASLAGGAQTNARTGSSIVASRKLSVVSSRAGLRSSSSSLQGSKDLPPVGATVHPSGSSPTLLTTTSTAAFKRQSSKEPTAQHLSAARRSSDTASADRPATPSSVMKGAGSAIVDHRKTSTPTDLVWVARAANLSLDNCKQAWELFRPQASPDGTLSLAQFAKILLQASGRSSLAELPAGMLDKACNGARKDNTSTALTFSDFAQWYSTWGFDENVTLTGDERSFRDLCRRHEMNVLEVERYQRIFNEFDHDGSGKIDETEFEGLLRRCARVSLTVEIPAARFRQLWKQCDVDGSGLISFEEFLTFYRKYFDDSSGECLGFEGYYRCVRPALGMH